MAAEWGRRLGVAAAMPRRDWADLLVAIAELLRSRATLVRAAAAVAAEPVDPAADDGLIDHRSAGLVKRIDRALGRACQIVPWRSDCLVRAQAAQHWLARHGVPGRIVFGARSAGPGRLDAHAWLHCGGGVGIGAGVPAFQPLTRPRRR